VIDNRVYPTTGEVAKMLKVPASRVRPIKELAASLPNLRHSRFSIAHKIPDFSFSEYSTRRAMFTPTAEALREFCAKSAMLL
jgi:hypothetical protein